ADEPLIGEPVQAWKYGPVIESIYHAYKIFGNRGIPDPVSMTSLGSPVHLEPFLNRIWDVYSKFTGGQLSTMTHQQDTPWDIVWNKKGGCSQRSAVIPDSIIKEHYKEKRKVNA
ncbi:MAG: Panacea domain-containing protein, partial [Roseimicrobium sp.]